LDRERFLGLKTSPRLIQHQPLLSRSDYPGTSELLLLYNEGSLENHFLELGSWDLWTLESYCSGALPIIQHRPVGGTKLAVVISLEPVSGNAGAPHHLSNSLEIPARN
jgi:hypothetical protein